MITKISEILDWYSKNCDTVMLSVLMTCRDRLAVLSYKLAEYVGDSQTEYNNAYFMRRISVSKKINSLTKEGLAVSKADNEALESSQELFNHEKEKESEAFKASLLLKQVNKVLDAMQQRISYQKNELENGRT